MTSLIEALARAIVLSEMPEASEEELTKYAPFEVPKAQAALTALQESGPTDEMVQAGCDVGPVGCCPLEPDQAREIFKAILSATEGGE